MVANSWQVARLKAATHGSTWRADNVDPCIAGFINFCQVVVKLRFIWESYGVHLHGHRLV